jgi:putative MATE family efflux protein
MPKDGRMTLFRLAWPLFIETFLRMLIGNVNVFMLSRYSDAAVGAVGIANQIIAMLMNVFNVVGLGTAIIVNQSLGAGEKEQAARVSKAAIAANFVFGILMSVLLSALSGNILRLMGTPEDLMKEARQYIAIVGGAVFCQALISTMSAILRCYGFTKYPMFVAFGMNILNVLGNALVVFRPFGMPAFGVAGIAITVVICNLAGVLAVSFVLVKKVGLGFGRTGKFQLRGKILADIVKIGAPAAGEYISYSITQVILTGMTTSLGSTAVMTRVYIQTVTVFISVLSLSLGLATQIRIGHMIGAGEAEQARKLCLKSLRIAVVINAALTLALILARKPVLMLFTKDPAILRVGSTILILDLLWETGRPLNHIVVNSLRGTGDVRYPTGIAILSMWGIGVPLSWFMGLHLHFGLVGIWLASAADEWFRGLIVLRRWYSQKWRQMAVVRAASRQEEPSA